MDDPVGELRRSDQSLLRLVSGKLFVWERLPRFVCELLVKQLDVKDNT
jgi:hypothetical protein